MRSVLATVMMLFLLLSCSQTEEIVDTQSGLGIMTNPFQSVEFESCLVENLPTGMARLIKLRDGAVASQAEINILTECINSAKVTAPVVDGGTNATPRRANWQGPNPFQDEYLEACILESLSGGTERLTELREGVWVEQAEFDVLNNCLTQLSQRGSGGALGGGKVIWEGGNPFLNEELEACLIESLPDGLERLVELREDAYLVQNELDLLNNCARQVARASGKANWAGTNPFTESNLKECLLENLPGGAARLKELQKDAAPTSSEIQVLNECIVTGQANRVGSSAGNGSGGSGGSSSTDGDSRGPSADIDIKPSVPIGKERIEVVDKVVPTRTTFPKNSLSALCDGNPDSAHSVDMNQPFYRLMRSQEIWELGCTGKGTVIVVIDSTDSSHPDFSENVILELCIGTKWGSGLCPNGEKFQEGKGSAAGDSSHGTSVTGAVNHFAPETQFILIKPAGSSGGFVGDTSGAYDWVISNATKYGIDAAVMSFGSGQSERELHREGRTDKCPNDHPVSPQFTQMRNLGVVPIFASGNDGQLDLLGFPACLNTTVSVGAADQYGNVQLYSNSHKDLTVLAPAGFQIPVGYDGGYGSPHGTSFAAPAYGALIAIGRQIQPDITVDELIEASRFSARPIDDVEVSNMRLIDFLGFAQHLAGQNIPERNSSLYTLDANYDIYVGETLRGDNPELSQLFPNIKKDGYYQYSIRIIDGFGEHCRTKTRESIGSLSPGKCVVAIERNELKKVDNRMWGPCPECGSFTKIIQVRSSKVTQSAVNGSLQIGRYESIIASKLVEQFGLTTPVSTFRSRVEVDILEGGDEVCSYATESEKIISISPGVCTVLLWSTYSALDTGRRVDMKSIIVRIRVK